MKKSYNDKIVKFIKLFEKDDDKKVNPIHLFFIVLLAFPVLVMNRGIHPSTFYFLIFVIVFQFIIFFLKYLVKDEFKDDIEDVKKSIPSFGIPSGINLFQVILFLLIASPFLFFIYGMIQAMFDK